MRCGRRITQPHQTRFWYDSMINLCKSQIIKGTSLYFSFRLSDNHSVPVSFFAYENAKLFPSTMLAKTLQDDDFERVVGSHVISATVEGFNISNLPEENVVETTFVLNKVSCRFVKYKLCLSIQGQQSQSNNAFF